MALYLQEGVRDCTWGVMFGSKKDLTAILPKSNSKLKFKEVTLKKSPPEIFSRVSDHYDYTYILESVEGPRKLAQYSFLGFNPQIVVEVKNGESRVWNTRMNKEVIQKVREPFSLLKKIITNQSVSFSSFRLVGGAVGYISYDAIRSWEKLPNTIATDTGFPDIEMGIFDDGIIFDHRNKRTFYYYRNKSQLNDVVEVIEETDSSKPLFCTKPKLSTTKEHFETTVLAAKEYIRSGDIFQVVLSKRYETNFTGPLFNFYQFLRRTNPSPYMYFLKMGAHQIVGSSPEMLVRIDNRIVETFPIAGTRPRGKDPQRDTALAKHLLADPKERAEHVMLVDLARNDVGKIAKYGSVRVPEFMTVHKYSHVQHIVSRVIGHLRRNYDCYDAVKALFPAGTVSGAPKVRAMEIIEESEKTRRGPYAGAVGYFSSNGNADFAITIRTLVAKENTAHIQVGAGIVADSDPEREWFETEHKAEALMNALKTLSRRNGIENIGHRQL
jgi:anthranilate synthase component 1